MKLPAPRSLLLNGLLALGACGLALAAAEGALRFAGDRILATAEYVAVGAAHVMEDPLLGYKPVPGASRLVARGGTYLIRETFNSAGLRDLEHTLTRQPGVKRILVLGDSFMQGEGVRMEESMPRRLAALSPGVEVVNAGVRGWDLGQEYLYYRDRGRLYEPDLVLVAFFVNDLEPAASMEPVDGLEGLPVRYRMKEEVAARARAEAPKGVRGAVSSWLRSHSMVYVLVRKRLDDWRASRRTKGAPRPEQRREAHYLPAFRTDPADDRSVALWARAHRILDALKATALSGGANLAIAIIPTPSQLTEEAWQEWVSWMQIDSAGHERLFPQEKVMAWCERTATPCIDLREALLEGGGKGLYLAYDEHWSAEGHRVAAHAVKDLLDAHGLP